MNTKFAANIVEALGNSDCKAELETLAVACPHDLAQLITALSCAARKMPIDDYLALAKSQKKIWPRRIQKRGS